MHSSPTDPLAAGAWLTLEVPSLDRSVTTQPTTAIKGVSSVDRSRSSTALATVVSTTRASGVQTLPISAKGSSGG